MGSGRSQTQPNPYLWWNRQESVLCCIHIQHDLRKEGASWGYLNLCLWIHWCKSKNPVYGCRAQEWACTRFGVHWCGWSHSPIHLFVHSPLTPSSHLFSAFSLPPLIHQHKFTSSKQGSSSGRLIHVLASLRVITNVLYTMFVTLLGQHRGLAPAKHSFCIVLSDMYCFKSSCPFGWNMLGTALRSTLKYSFCFCVLEDGLLEPPFIFLSLPDNPLFSVDTRDLPARSRGIISCCIHHGVFQLSLCFCDPDSYLSSIFHGQICMGPF